MTEGSDPLDEQIADFGPRLYAFAYALTRDREEASDLAQEAVTRALSHRDQFQPGSNLKAWLFTIVRNVHLNRGRALGTRPQIVALEDLAIARGRSDAPLCPVEHEVLDRAAVADALGALAEIPIHYAAPLRLAAIEELSYAEIAIVLDLPLGTVMSRIHRARRMLIARLGGTNR
ncbi:MAG: hypothetical protein NVS3B24_21980 [Candidatus Dormibacteria bacterium]